MLLLCMFYCPLTKDEIKELLLLLLYIGLEIGGVASQSANHFWGN